MEPLNTVTTNIEIMAIKVKHPRVRKQLSDGLGIIAPKILRVCALGILLLGGRAFATTVVVLRSSDGVFIGTDSRINDLVHHGTYTTGCKIHRFGNVYFMGAGMYLSPRTHFNVFDFAFRASTSPGSLMDKVNTFNSLIYPAVVEMINDAKLHDFVFYMGMSGSGIILEATFIEVSHGAGEAITKGYYIRDGEIRDDIKAMERTEGAGLVSGKQDAVQRFIKANPNWYSDLGAAGAIKRFLELEIVEEGDRVGPPISILKITPNGSEWIQRGACPEDIDHDQSEGHPKPRFNAGRL